MSREDEGAERTVPCVEKGGLKPIRLAVVWMEQQRQQRRHVRRYVTVDESHDVKEGFSHIK